MSKRIVLGGLLALGLTLAMSGAAQAQYRGYGGHYHGGYAPRVYAPVYPVYRPVVVAPSFGYGYGAPLYSGINSPYFGFGSGYRGYGYGFNSPGVLNIGYSRPGFGINFGTIIR